MIDSMLIIILIVVMNTQGLFTVALCLSNDHLPTAKSDVIQNLLSRLRDR